MHHLRLARDALGLGLRRPHIDALLGEHVELGYLEIIAESFLGPAPRLRDALAALGERYPIVVHGVGLNLMGPDAPSSAYLDAVAALAERVRAPFVTDHLCWTGAHGLSHHDLLPVPYVEELVELAAERARTVQAWLARPFGLENVSSYVTFARSELTEWDFFARVVERADCGALLDLNNVYVSSVNHGFEPEHYLARIDPARVLQLHVAGHTVERAGLLVDTHDAPLADPVLALHRRWVEAHGAVPTMLEWDARIPPLARALDELDRVGPGRRRVASA